MNDILPTPINEKRIPRVLAIILLLCSFLPVILNITCLSPLLFNLENNALYQGTAISLTVRYISNLLTVLSFSAVYAIIIFSQVLLKKKITVTVSVLYCALLLFKIPATLLMTIPIAGEIILADVLILLFYFLLDILQFALIFLFISITVRSYLRSIAILNKKGKDTQRILPINKPFNWYNPLLRAAVYSSITVASFRILERLLSIIGIVPPSTFGEVMIIITDFLTDIIYGIVAYIIAIFIFNLLYDKLTKSENSSSSDKENKADEKDSSALFED